MGGFPLGRVFGVRLALHWTVLIVFTLITVQLGAFLFPAWHPEWTPALSWSVALGAAVVFFASILVHELAHAIVGRVYDIPVRNITLFVFGGVAHVERRPPHPRAELLMAIAGPLTSLVLGIAFMTLSGFLAGDAAAAAGDPVELMASLGPLATLLAWVGPINVLIAIFNMLPGFPLDGGRVLRAILWGITGDLTKATRWASKVGRVLAMGLIAIGVLMALGVWIPFFGTGLGGGLWIALIGWFLYFLARTGYEQVVMERLLDQVHVRDVMARWAATTSPDASVREVVERLMMRSDQELVPVVEGGALVGLVSDADVRAIPHRDWDRRRVGEIMHPVGDMPVVSPDEDALEGLGRLNRFDVTELPVVDRGVFEGLLRRRDIARFLELQNPERAGAPA
jgi:Zn-dependent protease/CBS domain-containing protein